MKGYPTTSACREPDFGGAAIETSHLQATAHLPCRQEMACSSLSRARHPRSLNAEWWRRRTVHLGRPE